MKGLVFSIAATACLWAVMFSPWTAPHVSFWLMMSLSAAVLSCLSFLLGGGWRRMFPSWKMSDIVAGVLVAVALWAVFWLGDRVSSLLFDFARPQVEAI